MAGVVIGLLVIFGALAAYRLIVIGQELRESRDLILRASSDVQSGHLASARSELARAQELLTSANGRLYGKPEFDLLSWVPVVHQNLESLRGSVGVALELVSGGNRLLALTQPLENANGDLGVPLRKGTIPVATVQAVQREVEDLSSALPVPSSRPSTSFLLGPVADLQRVVYGEAEGRRSQFTGLSRALAIMSDLSGGNGPRRYLIAVANTAEMRGAGGMPLSYGVLESSGGTFKLGAFGNIDELALDAPLDPAKVRLPRDYLDRWSGQQPTFLWRNTTLAPELGFDAPVMEAMFSAKTGLSVSGVIQIDPSGLAAILKGTGPVDIPELGAVTADNVVDLTVNRAYIDFPNRDQRQEILGDVARAAFDALVNGDFESLRPLGDAVFEAVQERHIIFSPDSRSVHDETAFFHGDGELPPADAQDYAVLTVQNFSKNKLDYYVDTQLDLKGSRPRGLVGHVTATITVKNSAPTDVRSTYVFGPNTPGEVAGLYRGIVSLYLPTGTGLTGSSGDPTTQTPIALSEAGRTLVSFGVNIPAGESRVVTLTLELPPRAPGVPYSVRLVPIPRIRPTVVSVDLDAGTEQYLRPAAPLLVPTDVQAQPPRQNG